MQIVYYPEHTEGDPLGPISKFLNKLRKKRPDLWALVKATLKTARESSSLNSLEVTERVKLLKGVKEPIIRIPHSSP
ncbi:MAG: hypothetical protein PF447_00020 [Spirochaetaceae bacterium]|jgi:hypothetical protein|nr:hypothetical protein [Spirochaetaceae bacterium]